MGYSVISRTSEYPVASGANIKARDMIYIDGDGYAAPAAAPAADVVGTVVGSATSDVNNSAGADGDLLVVVEHSCGDEAFLLAAPALTIADVGKTVYVGANPKTVTTVATNAVKAGTLQGIESDGRARVIFPL